MTEVLKFLYQSWYQDGYLTVLMLVTIVKTQSCLQLFWTMHLAVCPVGSFQLFFSMCQLNTLGKNLKYTFIILLTCLYCYFIIKPNTNFLNISERYLPGHFIAEVWCRKHQKNEWHPWCDTISCWQKYPPFSLKGTQTSELALLKFIFTQISFFIS